eukprot:Hpha_TRINITY_DN18533_c0_g1::TRINITY_DN18533_c0_g1_i1::g.195175::m.195175
MCSFKTPTLPRPRRTIEHVEVWRSGSHLFLFGRDAASTAYRLLKISRQSEPHELVLDDMQGELSHSQYRETLAMIRDAQNAQRTSSGGGAERLQLVCKGHGLLGCIRFTAGYNLIVITRRRRVAQLGPHTIYEIAETEMVPILNPQRLSARQAPFNKNDEGRYMQILQGFDLGKEFYYSHTYDLTHSLQYNVQRKMKLGEPHDSSPSYGAPNDVFWWNDFLSQPIVSRLRSKSSSWVLPCIHGSLSQIVFNVLGRRIHLLLCARRSRYFAGTRFLKRGAVDNGHVANQMEIEQIVYDASSLSLGGTYGLFSSVVQVRGSIPIYWHQPTSDQKVHKPRPPIKLGRTDMVNAATKLHFAHLFSAYGSPIFALDLLKQKEKNPREQVLGLRYKEAIGMLNADLPPDKHIAYLAYDFRSASRAHGGGRTDEVRNEMASIAEEVLSRTGVFGMGDGVLQQQNGTVRTNCIDCLDRTNLAQLFVGKCALGLQLKIVGVDSDRLESDRMSTAVQTINEYLQDLYIQMGDRIALQYGGSRAQSAGLLGRSAVAEMWTTLHRYYNNNFVDLEKQRSINLFLGNYTPYVPREPQAPLPPDPVTPADSMEAVAEVGERYSFTHPLRYQFPHALAMPLCSTRGEVGTLCPHLCSFSDNTKVLELRAERAVALSRGVETGDDRFPSNGGDAALVPGEIPEERRVIDLWDLESDYYFHLQSRRGEDETPFIRLGARWWDVPLAVFHARRLDTDTGSTSGGGIATPTGSDSEKGRSVRSSSPKEPGSSYSP